MKLPIKHHGNYLENLYTEINGISFVMNTFFNLTQLLQYSNRHSLNDHVSKKHFYTTDLLAKERSMLQ